MPSSRATIAAGTRPPRGMATIASNGPRSASRQARARVSRWSSAQVTGKDRPTCADTPDSARSAHVDVHLVDPGRAGGGGQPYTVARHAHVGEGAHHAVGAAPRRCRGTVAGGYRDDLAHLVGAPVARLAERRIERLLVCHFRPLEAENPQPGA